MKILNTGYTSSTDTQQKTKTSETQKQQSFSDVLTLTAVGGKKTMVCQDALFSMGSAVTGESGNVYRADNYSEENPIYLVKGINAKGEEYEQIVDASKINLENCSFIELMVSNVEAGNTSDKSFLQMGVIRDKASCSSYFDKANYLFSIYELLKEQEQLGNWDSYLLYEKWKGR